MLAFEQMLRRAQRCSLQVVRNFARLQHREVVIGLRADNRGIGLQAVLEFHAHAARARDDMQAGEDDAPVDDDHTAADRALQVLVVLNAVARSGT